MPGKMPKVYNEKVVQQLIDRAVPGERVPRYLRMMWNVGFDYYNSHQGHLYWNKKMSGYSRWAKKDTKYLMELLGLEEEDDLWL
jgi:hypothetical protein